MLKLALTATNSGSGSWSGADFQLTTLVAGCIGVAVRLI